MELMNYIDLIDLCVMRAQEENRELDGEDIFFMNELEKLAAIDKNVDDDEFKCIAYTVNMHREEYEKRQPRDQYFYIDEIEV